MQGLDAFDGAELGCQLVSQDPIADEAKGCLDIALFFRCDQPVRQTEAPVKGLVNRFKQGGTLHAHANNAIEQDIDNAIAITKGVGVEG